MIDGIVNAGAMPVLEAAIGFAAERQKLIAHNLANLSTPDFVQQDVDPATFQRVLRDAVQERRDRAGTASGSYGELRLGSTSEIGFERGGAVRVRLTPGTPIGGAMMHDRNNRDLERLMQGLAENTAAYRVAIDLLRNQAETMRTAISQRV